MFSNKENVNILTSLLLAHGIRHAVVCPGSRNAPIVHNLSVCGGMRCVPVTDERSAGFVAIGIAQATGKPVVVCVTSGSALLNLAPAAAEACYQHLPLVVVSADRPQAWIGQLDGQTMPQADALGRFVRRAVSLGRVPFGSPTLSDQALMPFPSMKMGPGKSSRSHTADEFVFVKEIEEAIGLYLELLDGTALG